jgi:hypothetical protein
VSAERSPADLWFWECSCGATGYKAMHDKAKVERYGGLHVERLGDGHKARVERVEVPTPPAPPPPPKPVVHAQATAAPLQPEQVAAYVLAGGSIHALNEGWIYYRGPDHFLLFKIDREDPEAAVEALSDAMRVLARVARRRLAVERALDDPAATALRATFGGNPR